MYHCKEIARLNSERQDRRLTLLERCLYRVHLLLCPPCQRHRQQLDILHGAAAQTGDAPSSGPGMSADAKARLQARLRAAGEDQPGS